jgi:hypothetical protein
MSSIQERAARYIEKMPPAIAGQGGSTEAFNVSFKLVQGFALDPGVAASVFKADFNSKCIPPFSDAEILRKCQDALGKTPRDGRGFLLANKDLDRLPSTRPPSTPSPSKPKSKLRVQNERMPSTREWRTIADSRGLYGPGVFLAARLGLLRVGELFGFDVYGIGDAGGPLAMVRRIDGEPFPSYQGRAEIKSLTLVSGDDFHRPFGFFPGAPIQAIALCEGVPDWLALWDQVVYEYRKIDVFDTEDIESIKALIRCIPLVMPSTTSRINDDFIGEFKGMAVRVYVDNDESGRNAAMKWARSIVGVVRSVDQFDCSAYGNEVGRDFNDCFTMVLDGSLPK